MSDDPEAKAAVIWMAGEYGQDIPDAPYMLESAVGSYSQVRFYELQCDKDCVDSSLLLSAVGVYDYDNDCEALHCIALHCISFDCTASCHVMSCYNETWILQDTTKIISIY